MTAYQFQPMTKEYASMICTWQYDDPYSIYSMDGDEESISELLNGEYYCAFDNANTLIGYICGGNAARVPGGYPAGIYADEKVIDIGLGLRPDFTGKGNGEAFLTQAIEYMKGQLAVRDFQLVVATFNERAIKVYERVGFAKGVTFKSEVGDREVEFLSMQYSVLQ